MKARTNTPTAYWWTGVNNFGDLLTPMLLDWFSGIEVSQAPAETADIVCVGSVVEHLPAHFSGIVAGSGKIKVEGEHDLRAANVLGLRGPLTAKLVQTKNKDFVIGDPGLLANEFVNPRKEHNLGIVPHWSDQELEHRPEFTKYDPLIIRATDSPVEVIRQIGSCKKIISSSLHGLILADAYGIPRRTEMCQRVLYEGGDFKYRDHCAAIGLPFRVGETQFAPRHRVEARQHEIYDLFSSIGNIFHSNYR